MAVLHERPATVEACDEMIVEAEARAARACRDHDPADEWDAECDLYVLWEIRAELIPEQREP